MAAEEFLQRDWARSPRHFPGPLADVVGGILDLAAFERLLATASGAADGWLQLADGNREIVPRHMVDRDGMLDLAQVRAAFAAGKSLYLTKAERLWLPLLDLTRAVELDLAALGVALRRSVNAHVFCTPPGAQAFRPHRDEHASFVVQLEGSKEWTLHESPPGPVGVGAVDPASLTDRPPRSYVLGPGDVLYMPEWWVHAARTTSSHSLHVTIRVFPLRWSDVLHEVVDAAQLGRALPRHQLSDPEAMARDLGALLASPDIRDALPAVLPHLRERAGVPTVVLPDDGLRQVLDLEEIRADTALERAAGVACSVGTDAETATLRFPGGTVSGPVGLAPLFEYVRDHPALRPADLPAVAEAAYDALAVARQLIGAGILRRAPVSPPRGR